jgi:hypothetical protein
MVDNFQPHSLFASDTEGAVTQQDESAKRENPEHSQRNLGWKGQRTFPLFPVTGDVFSVDFPLYRTRLPISDS